MANKIISTTWINKKIEDLEKSKTKFKEHNIKDWIEIPDYKISILKELQSELKPLIVFGKKDTLQKIPVNSLLPVPVVEWMAVDKDDFTFRTGKYCLRVEQMDKKVWWWCVYYGDEYVAFDYPTAITELEAKLLAELSFVRHWYSSKTLKNKKLKL